MKKSLNVNLAGVVFHIDEDAYHLLNNYLNSLQEHYKAMPDGNEIITDIELRIAEIFQENLSQIYTVVSIAEVERAIELIGRPEDFMDENPEEDNASFEQNTFESNSRPKHRKLYRDPDARYLAGVAAGLAHFLGVAPLYVRIGFVLLHLFYGLGIFLYIALWVLVKEAATSAQKLEMRGEQVNLSNIEKTIRDEFENVKKNVQQGFENGFKNIPFETFARRLGNIIRKVLEGLGVAVRSFFRLAAILIGLAFTIGGTITFAILVTMLVFPNLPFAASLDGGAMLQSIVALILPSHNILFATVGLLLFLGVPIVAIVYAGIKITLQLHNNSKAFPITLLVLWLVGLGIVSSIGVKTAQNYSNSAHIDQTLVLDKIQLDTINISMKNMPLSEEVHNSMKLGSVRVLEEGGKVLGLPRFDIKQAHGSEMKLEVERSSQGFNKKNAGDNAEKIDYDWEASANQLLFNHYFRLNGADRWLNQELRIVLRLPVGKVVYLDESMLDIIYDIKNLQNMWDGHMGNKYWVMTEKGLSVVNPEQYREEEVEWPEKAHKEELEKVAKELRELEKNLQNEIETEVKQALEETREALIEREKELQELEEELENS